MLVRIALPRVGLFVARNRLCSLGRVTCAEAVVPTLISVASRWLLPFLWILPRAFHPLEMLVLVAPPPVGGAMFPGVHLFLLIHRHL